MYGKDLTSKVDQIIANWRLPGCAIGIEQEGVIELELYRGEKILGSGNMVDQNTIFCVASVSKVLVAIAIWHLHEQGVLDILQPITSYLPYVTMRDPKYKQITIEMVLSHRSGLPDLTMGEYRDVLNNKYRTYKDYILSFQNKSLEAPGSQFIYSNFGYSILADIIAVTTGSSFNDYMKSEILDPIGMIQSSFDMPSNMINVAHPHLRIPQITPSKRYPYSIVDAPASFLHTTVRDMLSLHKNLHSLVSRETWKRMTQPITQRSYPPFYMATGMGINIGEFHHQTVYSHGGMGFGFTAFYMTFPELNVSAVIMTNQESYAHEQLSHLIAQAITNVPLTMDRPSWLIPFTDTFVDHGAQAAIQLAKRIQDMQEYATDKEDLSTVIDQMIVANCNDELQEYSKAYLQLFPDDTKVRDMVNKCGVVES